jgi:beta-glucosidase
MVTTDWGMKYDPVREVMAGNDMKMHVGYPADLRVAFDAGKLTRADLQLCVKRILEMTMRFAN